MRRPSSMTQLLHIYCIYGTSADHYIALSSHFCRRCVLCAFLLFVLYVCVPCDVLYSTGHLRAARRGGGPLLLQRLHGSQQLGATRVGGLPRPGLGRLLLREHPIRRDAGSSSIFQSKSAESCSAFSPCTNEVGRSRSFPCAFFLCLDDWTSLGAYPAHYYYYCCCCCCCCCSGTCRSTSSPWYARRRTRHPRPSLSRPS